MDNLGLVVFSDGNVIPFGKIVYMDQDDYFDAPGHEDSFKKEILSSFNFKFDGLIYDEDNSFYNNAVSLSKQGLMIILNNKSNSFDPENILGYLPSSATSEQLDTIKNMIDTKKFDKFEQSLYEFDVDDVPIKYDNLEQYYSIKIGKTM